MQTEVRKIKVRNTSVCFPSTGRKSYENLLLETRAVVYA